MVVLCWHLRRPPGKEWNESSTVAANRKGGRHRATSLVYGCVAGRDRLSAADGASEGIVFFVYLFAQLVLGVSVRLLHLPCRLIGFAFDILACAAGQISRRVLKRSFGLLDLSGHGILIH